MHESSFIEFLDIYALTYLIYHRLTIFLPTYRQRNEPDPSPRPSRTTPGIDFEVAWAPTFGTERGSVHLPITSLRSSRTVRWTKV
jgi:hypothetical protein